MKILIYFMLLKFGIGRATSDAAHEIREGVIEREEAVQLDKKIRYRISWLTYTQIFRGWLASTKNIKMRYR